VNKVNSQAELRFNVSEADWMGEELKERFLEVHASKITKSGEIVIVSQKERRQEANIRDCMERLEEYLEEASVIPKERKPTKAPAWAKEKRLEDKKYRSSIKQNRSGKDW